MLCWVAVHYKVTQRPQPVVHQQAEVVGVLWVLGGALPPLTWQTLAAEMSPSAGCTGPPTLPLTLALIHAIFVSQNWVRKLAKGQGKPIKHSLDTNERKREVAESLASLIVDRWLLFYLSPLWMSGFKSLNCFSYPCLLQYQWACYFCFYFNSFSKPS